MADSLYKKMYNINILRRAWHLARNDTRTDFISDVFKYNDFTFKLEENLQFISLTLKNEEYRPKPLLNIDVPKSTLAVRPGSVISIYDRIVLFAITLLIAPKLDKRLPEGVYSYRLKEKIDKQSLFKDLEILKFPFLKGITIRKRVDIIEPWYGQWPKFVKKTIYTFEKEEYKFLTISDISAYFENINLSILRDILIKYLPREQKIINLLYSLLKYWTWPTTHGFSIERGIPQGNSISSFLGNIYLLPLDEEFMKLVKKENIRYFRYMDDVRIFSKKEDVARESVFVMNKTLRKLHLNIQGSKTMILGEKEIREELIDKRLDEVNKIIENINKNSKLIEQKEREEYINRLKEQYKKIGKKNKSIQGKDLRLYRRLITGFTLLLSPYMVNSVLKQLPKNPDNKLISSAARYFKTLPWSNKKISKGLIHFLESPINLFPYQEAYMLMVLRYLKEIPDEVISYARQYIRLKNKHWYVRVQAILLLESLMLQPRSLISLKKIYKNESNLEIRRALTKCLCQLNKEKLLKFLTELLFENYDRLVSLGQMLLSLYYNRNNAADCEISNIFWHFDEDILLDSYYKIEVIKYCNQNKVRINLLKKLNTIRRVVKKKCLKKKVDNTIKFLKRGQEQS